MSDDGMLKVIIFGLAGGGFFFFKGIKDYFRKKLIENTPTSKVRSIAMGFVELYGKVVPADKVLKSPWTHSDCVYYRYVVEEYVRSKDNSYWRTIGEDIQHADFFLQDDTGKVLVDPEGAQIDIPQDFQTQNMRGMPLTTRRWMDEKHIRVSFLGFARTMRFTEYYVAPGDKLYIMGSATTRPGSENAVKNEAKIRIKKGTLNRNYYISDSDENKILKTLRWLVPLQVFGGFALFLVGLLFLFLEMGVL